MSNQQIINECKTQILEELAKANGDILKSDLYDLIETGETTDIAMAIKSLRDEGKIVVFGDGKSSRIMSGSNIKDSTEATDNLDEKNDGFLYSKSPVNTVTTELAKVIEEVKNAPEGSKLMSPDAGGKVVEAMTEFVTTANSGNPGNIPVNLPKQIPGNLKTSGIVASAAYCLFIAKTNNKFDALTLDIIVARLKFKGLRASLNNAVDYLVKNGYVTKHRDGAKPIFYWSNKFSRPFERVGVIPEPIEKGTRSPFAPEQVEEKQPPSINKDTVNTFIENSSYLKELEQSSTTTKLDCEEIPCTLEVRKLTEWECRRLSEIDKLISDSSSSINSLAKFIDSLIKERASILNT